MSLVTFDAGPMRTERQEITPYELAAGFDSGSHAHPAEETVYVLSGRIRVTLGGESYEVEARAGSFHPSGVEHAVEALEDSKVVSFKNVVEED